MNSKIVNPFRSPGHQFYSAPGNATTYNLIKKLSMESWLNLKKNTKAYLAEGNYPV